MEIYRNIVLNRKNHGLGHMVFHDGPVPYLSFPLLDRAGIRHGYSTRLGGVSTGYFAEMNLAALKEPPEIIQENYRRIAEALHMDEKRVVLTYQTHSSGIRVVTEADAGKGPFRERDYTDTDAIITNVPDLPLAALSADCCLLYFADPVKKCIGLAHAGWRGTAADIAGKTIKKLTETYGTDPKDLLCALGPSICQDCYEVSEDVIQAFRLQFDAAAMEILAARNERGRYQLDLWRANRMLMIRAGVPETQIEITDLCSKCNPELFFSHRLLGEKRGVTAALLCI